MSTIHELKSVSRAQQSAAKSAAPRAARVTDAQLKQALRNAHAAGLTIYAFTIEGGTIRVQTRPEASADAIHQTDAEAWFDART
ncbi:hypothetical protein AB9K35_07550 [Leisingera sp. XS_AS12]|uniref:hypothetical protein n=1 Tax=Leisingera TaxID=191028 RepID=UPI000427BD18|nr:hypothetical protein [Leisingera caerulea]